MDNRRIKPSPPRRRPGTGIREAANVFIDFVDPTAVPPDPPVGIPTSGSEIIPPPPPGAHCEHNLPRTLLVGFIERQESVGALLKALREEEVLVTLTGMGGVGKTRLAVEVGRRIACGSIAEACGVSFSDGVWFVKLEDIDRKQSSSESVLWSTLREQLPFVKANDPSLHPAADITAQLKQCVLDSLKSKRLLLILDNCEHLNRKTLTSVVKAICDQSPSSVRILATSRRALGLPFEKEISLGMMTAPELDDSPDTLWKNEAVKLFVARARPGGKLLTQEDLSSDDHVRCIARICRKVDCIPLAIELAAFSAKRYLTLEALLAALHQRLTLRGDATAPKRHKTLEETIRWSYSLLEDDEKRLFRHLAVFQGGWLEEDVHQVCFAGQGDPSRARDLLLCLLEAHLIVQEEVQGQPIYRFLDTISEYARMRFSADRHRAEVERRHCVHFANMLLRNVKAPGVASPATGDQALVVHERNILEALSRAAREEPDLSIQILKAIEDALPDLETPANYPRFRTLYPFAVACRTLVAALPGSDPPIFVLDKQKWLKKLHRGLELQELFAGANDWDVLFGSKEPSFKTLRDNIENKEWQDEARCTIAVLANMPEKEPALLMFACMYFLTFDWWEAYLKDGSKSEYLLEAWEHYHDDALGKVLRKFCGAYPQSSDWRGRSRKQDDWRAVEESLSEVQKSLKVDVPAAELKTPVHRYLRAITDRYRAEALYYQDTPDESFWGHFFRAPGKNRRPPARAPQPAAWQSL